MSDNRITAASTSYAQQPLQDKHQKQAAGQSSATQEPRGPNVATIRGRDTNAAKTFGLNRDLTDHTLLKEFAGGVAVYGKDGKTGEASSDHSALILKFIGGPRDITSVGDNQPPYRLDHFPKTLINLNKRDSLEGSAERNTFMLQPTLQHLMENAGHFSENGRVILAHTNPETLAELVTALQRQRPDLTVYGHHGNGVEAFRQVGLILYGRSAEVTRSLKRDDAEWVSRKSGLNVPSGTAITAPFKRSGALDRSEFQKALTANREGVVGKLGAEIEPQSEREMPATVKGEAHRDVEHFMHMVGIRTTKPSEVHELLKSLGVVAVVGETGKIGTAVLRTVGAKVPEAIGLSRRPDDARVQYLGTGRKPVYTAGSVPDGTNVDTVFITASVDWPKGDDGKPIFDRAALFGGNIPIMKNAIKDITPGALVPIITNPCSDMGYFAHMARPDLTILAHGGTDYVRQQNLTTNPNDPTSYFVLGPHSPNQVNPDLAIMALDNRIPTLGQVLAEQSADETGPRSVTDPTATACVAETVNLKNGKPGCYALPLTADEAAKLKAYMASMGKEIEVHEGIAPTLPRNAQREIDWAMLENAKSITQAKGLDGNVKDIEGGTGRDGVSYADRAFNAIQELEKGRLDVLDAVVKSVKDKAAKDENPDLANVDHEWVLANKGNFLQHMA